MLEKDLRKRIILHLEERGWLIIPYPGSTQGLRGTPDLIAVKEGRTIWLEVKTNVGRLSSVQAIRIRNLRHHGAEVHVARSLAELDEKLLAGAKDWALT